MKRIFVFITICVSFFAINSVKAYDKYNMGEIIKWNQYDYVVLSNSNSDEDSVKVVRLDPLTHEEIEATGVSVNSNILSTYDVSKGQMAYYSSETCGYVDGVVYTSGCTNSYEDSDVKKVLDKWVEQYNDSVLELDDNVKVKLLELDTLPNIDENTEEYNSIISQIISGMTTDDYILTAIPHSQARYLVMALSTSNQPTHNVNVNIYDPGFVNPVINIKKSALNPENISTNDNDEAKVGNNNNNSSGDNTVNVANTLLKQSILTLIIGGLIIVIGVIIYIVNKKRK